MSRGKYTYEYPKADITVDCVLFGISPEGRLEVVLIRRAEEPFKGKLALPGGFIEFLQGETARNAARREMEEETGAKIEWLEQLKTFDDPDRDPRGRVFSVAHFALVRTKDHAVVGGSDALEAKWVAVEDAIKLAPKDLAFDHHLILRTAVDRLQAKVRYEPIGFHLLPKTFTLGQLQHLYEAILFRTLDRGNFRKRVRILNHKTGILVDTGRDQDGTFGPAAKLYSFNEKAYAKAVKDGLNFEI
jgi:8-oxo-dGTP diphosphatase